MGKIRRGSLEGGRDAVWNLPAVRAAFEAADVAPLHLPLLMGWLARHPSCESWSEVWEDAKLSGMPLKARRLLEAGFVVRSTKVEERHDSSDGSTTKLVIRLLRDNLRVETVVMRHGTLRSRRVTVCVSSQVGCAMACSFCATGTMGELGNLDAAEIVEQFVSARAIAKEARNVVFMGMGEPMNNYDAVLGACARLFDDKMFALAHGRVTISTVGVAPRICTLALDEPRASLALSLHAPSQHQREAIMPAARGYKLETLFAALETHVSNKMRAISNPRLHARKSPLVMVEYILLGEVNDSDADATALGQLLAPPALHGRCMVNLIAYNPVPGLPYDRPTEERVRAFQDIVQAHGLLVCVRLTMGSDVAGACGQLLKQRQREEEPTTTASSSASSPTAAGATHRPAVRDLEDSPFDAPTPRANKKTAPTRGGARAVAAARSPNAEQTAPPPKPLHTQPPQTALAPPLKDDADAAKAALRVAFAGACGIAAAAFTLYCV